MAVRKGGNATGERFDESFVLRMIRDFFLSLLVLISLESAARFGYTLWQYETEEAQRTERSAERLAEDLRDIMLNRGGPVAARTVYPILERDYAKRGLEIAIEPSDVTVQSVGSMIAGPPRGIPPDWPDGRHHEARVGVTAEPFCIQCHSEAKPGDTLGWVTVRSYRENMIGEWLGQFYVSGLFGMGNIIVESMVLLVLLRVRMAPIHGLGAVVSRLAKAGSDLGHRAPVRTGDEFGLLARDLNLFLDRLAQIIEDMGRVLARVEALAGDVDSVAHRMNAHAEALGRRSDSIDRGVAADAALGELVAALAEASAGAGDLPGETRARIAALDRRWREASGGGSAEAQEDLVALRGELRAFAASAAEIAPLEERMQALAAEGKRLLARLGHEASGAGREEGFDSRS